MSGGRLAGGEDLRVVVRDMVVVVEMVRLL